MTRAGRSLQQTILSPAAFLKLPQVWSEGEPPVSCRYLSLSSERLQMRVRSLVQCLALAPAVIVRVSSHLYISSLPTSSSTEYEYSVLELP